MTMALRAALLASFKRSMRSILIAGLALGPTFVQAQTLIRDTEIEAILTEMTLPLMEAGGVDPSSVRLRLVQDPSVNAFVTSTRTIYLHTGLIARLDEPDMLQAVIAHELGHIIGGHAAARGVAAQAAGEASAVGVLAGVLVGVVAGPGAGIAVAAGSQSAASNQFFATSRADESAADQTGLRLLEGSGIDPAAKIDTLSIFADQELLPNERKDPYARTHPYASDRIELLRPLVDRSENTDAQPSEAIARGYRRIRAKLEGFIDHPADVLSRTRDDPSFEAKLARAIAFQRYPDPDASLDLLSELLSMSPQDPFLHELKGQFQIENGNLATGIEHYRTALSLRPQSPLIKAALGRALVADGTISSAEEAIRLFDAVTQEDSGVPGVLRARARAHATLGEDGLAALAMAQFHTARRSFAEANRFARSARENLPEGTPAWLRADDLVNDTSGRMKRP